MGFNGLSLQSIGVGIPPRPANVWEDTSKSNSASLAKADVTAVGNLDESWTLVGSQRKRLLLAVSNAEFRRVWPCGIEGEKADLRERVEDKFLPPDLLFCPTTDNSPCNELLTLAVDLDFLIGVGLANRINGDKLDSCSWQFELTLYKQLCCSGVTAVILEKWEANGFETISFRSATQVCPFDSHLFDDSKGNAHALFSVLSGHKLSKHRLFSSVISAICKRPKSSNACCSKRAIISSSCETTTIINNVLIYIAITKSFSFST